MESGRRHPTFMGLDLPQMAVAEFPMTPERE